MLTGNAETKSLHDNKGQIGFKQHINHCYTKNINMLKWSLKDT